MASDEAGPEPLPISLVAHQVFCPRRAWLEAVGESTDTQQMAVGTTAHRPADDVQASRSARVRALDVESRSLGVVGRCDSVEVSDDGRLTVVEHKATPLRRRAEVTDPTRVQVALQSIALSEMGHDVTGQAVYFTEHRTRVPVALDAELLKLATESVAATRRTVSASTAPPPLEDSPKCPRCSHVEVCLPDERALAPVTRRILVADPDSQVVHLATPGSRASVRRGRLEVVKNEEKLGSVPLERVQGVVLHGNVDLSGALIRELLWRGLSVVWCSSSGRVVGWSNSAQSPNGGARSRQRDASRLGRLDLAREFVAAKISNQATILRRHGNAPTEVATLRNLQRAAGRAGGTAEIFGIEGDAAARYFAHFASMLSVRVRRDEGVNFTGRTRRPARDPVNAALNMAYGLLTADIIRAVVACGLDPHDGFLHSSERNKPALALDLGEEFRAPIADSVVFGAFNNGEIGRHDFHEVLGVVNLRVSGRKALIAAYERRVGTTFKHPTFGYEVSWRRAMEIQARLLLGLLDGTQSRYIGIRVH